MLLTMSMASPGTDAHSAAGAPPTSVFIHTYIFLYSYIYMYLYLCVYTCNGSVFNSKIRISIEIKKDMNI